MGLVDYSDSDNSDAEETKATKPTPSTSKPAFQKVVDRSNPGKIKVSLPQSSLKRDTPSDEPPAKKSRTGGGRGAFSGFNSFLPAPKKAGTLSNATPRGATASTKGFGGVSLKTGAAPGFSREPEPEREYGKYEEYSEERTKGTLSEPQAPQPSQPADQKPAEEVKLVGKPTMFRPLSVARKPKKKTAASMLASSIVSPSPPQTPLPQTPAEKAPRAKVSLFTMSTEDTPLTTTPSQGEYEPMILQSQSSSGSVSQLATQDPYSIEENTPNTSQNFLPFAPTPPVSQSLDDIAGDLHLSAAERRQLFGRQKGGVNQHSATKVINFNTDQEYMHNEELRASGEQIKHNPVRAIAPGKHSLKQLVNAAQSQKEALEESFQAGKNNRKEASSRYGW